MSLTVLEWLGTLRRCEGRGGYSGNSNIVADIGKGGEVHITNFVIHYLISMVTTDGCCHVV
jgi:hypothetical protein